MKEDIKTRELSWTQKQHLLPDSLILIFYLLWHNQKSCYGYEI